MKRSYKYMYTYDIFGKVLKQTCKTFYEQQRHFNICMQLLNIPSHFIWQQGYFVVSQAWSLFPAPHSLLLI